MAFTCGCVMHLRCVLDLPRREGEVSAVNTKQARDLSSGGGLLGVRFVWHLIWLRSGDYSVFFGAAAGRAFGAGLVVVAEA